MTTIRTKCPTCGDVDLGVGAISMFLTASGDHGEYTFACPECAACVSKPASRRTASLLIAAGVEPSKIEDAPPAHEIAPEDLSPDPHAHPLTLDDLLAFHFLLEDDVAVAEELAIGA